MNRFLLAAFAMMLAFSYEASAHAFWCQNRTVHIGDHQVSVRSICVLWLNIHAPSAFSLWTEW